MKFFFYIYSVFFRIHGVKTKCFWRYNDYYSHKESLYYVYGNFQIFVCERARVCVYVCVCVSQFVRATVLINRRDKFLLHTRNGISELSERRGLVRKPPVRKLDADNRLSTSNTRSAAIRPRDVESRYSPCTRLFWRQRNVGLDIIIFFFSVGCLPQHWLNAGRLLCVWRGLLRHGSRAGRTGISFASERGQ